MKIKQETTTQQKSKYFLGYKKQELKRYLPVYLMMLPGILLVFVFNYCPLPGILIAFMDYDIMAGFGSDWAGLKNFVELFSIPSFGQSILNTLLLSFLNLVIGFPMPIILALLLNEARCKIFKRTVQTISYMPYFISWIAVIGIASSVFSIYGIVNDVRVALFGEGTERIMYLSLQELFVPNVIMLSVWKGAGWGTIIYLAAITSIDPSLYEAATVDGAGKFKQCWHITLPGLAQTIIILLILQIGNMFYDNFDLIYGLQNPFIDFDVISTKSYSEGITQGKYDLAAALGLFQGLIGLTLVTTANKISKKINGYSMW